MDHQIKGDFRRLTGSFFHTIQTCGSSELLSAR